MKKEIFREQASNVKGF